MNPHPPEITVFSAILLLGTGAVLAITLLVFLLLRRRGRRLSFSLRWFVAFCLACAMSVGGGARRHLAQAQARDYRDALIVKKRLSRKLTMELGDASLTDVLAFMSSLCKTQAVIENAQLQAEKGSAPIDLCPIYDMTAEGLFLLIARTSGLQCEIKGSRIIFVPRSPATLAKDAEQEKKLATTVSIDFLNTPPREAIRELSRLAQMELVLDNDVEAIMPGEKITLHLKDVEVRNALKWVMRHAGWNVDSLNGGEFCETPNEEAVRRTRHNAEIEKRLNECLVSFEFTDKPLSEALDFIATSAHVNIIVDPDQLKREVGNTPINLRVTSMSAGQALRWILKLTELEYDIRNEAVFCAVKSDV